MSSVYRQKGDYDKALECCTKSLSIQLKILGENHPYVAFSYDRIGSVWRRGVTIRKLWNITQNRYPSDSKQV